MQRNMSKPNTQIAFRAREEDREHLRVLAAKARCSQGALLLKLLYDYGEAAVEQLRTESTAAEASPSEPELRLYWLTDGEELARSAWFTDDEFRIEQFKANDATDGNIWWVQSDTEPDLPKSSGFREIDRFS